MKENTYPLNKMTEGETACVCNLKTKGNMRRRLRDIGIIENTKIKCLQKSPSGDPIAYLVRGAVIAIRNEDSENIIVK